MNKIKFTSTIKEKLKQFKNRKIIDVIKSIQIKESNDIILKQLNELSIENILTPISRISVLPSNKRILIFEPNAQVNILSITLEEGNELLLETILNKLTSSESIKEQNINVLLESFFKRGEGEHNLNVNLTKMLDLMVKNIAPITWYSAPENKNDLLVEKLSLSTMYDSYLHKAIKTSYKKNPAYPHPTFIKTNNHIPFYIKVPEYEKLVDYLIENGYTQQDNQGDLLSLAVGFNDIAMIEKLFDVPNIDVDYAKKAIKRCEVIDEFLENIPNHHNMDDKTSEDTLSYLKSKVEKLSLEKILNENNSPSLQSRLKI